MPAAKKTRQKIAILPIICGVLAVVAVALLFNSQLHHLAKHNSDIVGLIAAVTYGITYVITGFLTGWK